MPATMLLNITTQMGLQAEPASTLQGLYPSLKPIQNAYWSTACSSVAGLQQLSLSFGFQRIVLDPRDVRRRSNSRTDRAALHPHRLVRIRALRLPHHLRRRLRAALWRRLRR